MTVLEIDAHVIALRELFGVPPDDERLQVIHCDGATISRIRTSAAMCCWSMRSAPMG